MPIAPRAAAQLRELLAPPGILLDVVLPEESRDYDDTYRMFEAARVRAGLHDHGAAHRGQLASLREELTEREERGEQLALEKRRQLERLACGKPRLKATRSWHGVRHTFGVACARAGLQPTVIKGYEEFSRAFKDSPMKRAKLRGLNRNAAVLLGDVGPPDDVDALTRALDDPEPLVREHAAWALERLQRAVSAAPERREHPGG